MSIGALCTHRNQPIIPSFYPSSTGYGEDARTSNERVLKTWSRIKFSGQAEIILESLFETYRNYCEVNWDGEGANPISYEACLEAAIFLLLLSSSLMLPEVVPEPTGQIGLEWHRDRFRVFGVSFSGEGIITYAGMFGEGITAHGTELFADFIPPIIIDHLKRLSFSR